MSPDNIAPLGIARTFQNIELFEHSTVLHNLLVGRHSQRKTHWIEDMLFLPSAARRAEIEHRERAEEVIDFLDLQPYREKMIAGCHTASAKWSRSPARWRRGQNSSLLDEPASGLSVEETQDVAFWIEDMQKDMGLTVLMVEHDMSLVSQVSDRVLAIADGRPLAMGTSAEVQGHPDVIAAYLGVEEDAA